MGDRRRRRIVFGAAAVLAVTAAGVARGRPPIGTNTLVPIAEVPAVVREAAKKAAPGIPLETATTNVFMGMPIFDFYGKDGRGREVDVEVSAQGAVVGVAMRVEMDEVPPAVLTVWKRVNHGNVEFADAESVTRDGALIHYRFEGKNAEGEDVVATVSPDCKKSYLYGKKVVIRADRPVRPAGPG